MRNQDRPASEDSLKEEHQKKIKDSPEEKRQKRIEEEVKESEKLLDDIEDVAIIKRIAKKEIRSEVRRRLLEEEEKVDYKIKYEAEKRDKEAEHEKYVQSYALLSLWLHLGQLKREFREGSKAPNKEQMVNDLEKKNEVVAFTNVSIHYIEWLWFLRCSNYGPAKDLYKMVMKKFESLTDFVEQLSHVWGEASEKIHYPQDPLTPEEIKRGLKLYGLNSKRMNSAIDVLFQLKNKSPRKRHERTKSKVDLDQDSSSSESQSSKRVKLDRSKFRAETDSSSALDY